MQITCNWKKDNSTGTQGGKLSKIWSNENDDEMFLYIENTETLIARRQPVQQGTNENNKQLPLRKSLFAHVPQYIVFQITDVKFYR